MILNETVSIFAPLLVSLSSNSDIGDLIGDPCIITITLPDETGVFPSVFEK